MSLRVMSTVSVGFQPIEYEPNKSGGFDFKEWELLELSCVAVPCDSGAITVARSMHGKSGRVLNGKNALERSLGKSTEAHEAACEQLEKADRHRHRGKPDEVAALWASLRFDEATDRRGGKRGVSSGGDFNADQWLRLVLRKQRHWLSAC
jgi:hypothetical protein